MKRGKFRKAVFIVVYSINSRNKKPEYLLLKRKLHWTGWEFPKGGVEWYELKRCAVRRELKEEAGISKIKKITRFNESGRYKYAREYSDRKGFVGQTYTLFAAQVEKPGKISLDKREHSTHCWLPYGNALKKLKYPNQKRCLEIVNTYLKINSLR